MRNDSPNRIDDPPSLGLGVGGAARNAKYPLRSEPKGAFGSRLIGLEQTGRAGCEYRGACTRSKPPNTRIRSHGKQSYKDELQVWALVVDRLGRTGRHVHP
jgi:hypothetical protein